uniref:Proteasome 20S subunit beta 9a n=1 Tax=Xiphophorus couchianus TaxID=32473 RepID=A0A3B5MC06_9TELE
MLGEAEPQWLSEEVKTGTTIIAIEFNGGVVLGFYVNLFKISPLHRYRFSSDYFTGVMNKLSPLHDKIYCALSGSAADAQTIAEMVNYQLDVHSMEIGEDPQVRSAATLVKNISYKYKEELSCQQFVVNTLSLAMNRDGSSGGVAYLVTIDQHGTEEKVILGNDLPTFFDQ